MASEPTNSNPNTKLSEKPSKAKEEGELSSNDADDDDKDNNNNVLFSKTLVHIQTFQLVLLYFWFHRVQCLIFVFMCHFSLLSLCFVAEKIEETAFFFCSS